MALTDFTIIRRSMTSRRFSTVTTIITVAAAVGLMLVLLSMRDAGRRAFERGSGNMHLFLSRDASPLTGVLNGIFYASPPRRSIEWAKYQEIAAGFPLEYAVPIQLGDSYEGEFRVLATEPSFFSQFHPDPDRGWELANGRLFTGDFEVVVGSAAASSTGLKAGDRLYLTHGIGKSREASAEAVGSADHHAEHDENEKPDPAVKGGSAGGHVHHDFTYTVVGVLKPTGAAHDRALFTSLNSSWIVHAQERREEAAGAGGHIEKTSVADLIESDKLITGIYVRVVTRPGSDVSSAIQQVFDQLRRDPSITVAAPRQEIDKLFTIVGNIDQLFLAMAAVVMISSGIAVMLALYNSMEQRRRQIAVLRVLGCSQWRIFGLIVTESAMIGLLGALAGLALSVLGGMIVAAVMKERLGLVIQPTFDPGWTLGVMLGTIALAAAAGLVPGIMAYRTPVATNLKPIG